MSEINKLMTKLTLLSTYGMFENIPSHEEYDFNITKKI